MAEIIRHPSSETNWELYEKKDNDVRYIPVAKEPREHVQFRALAKLVRQVDEYVASRVDPLLKTRSDVFNDALAIWCNTHDDGNDLIRALAQTNRLDYMNRKQQLYELRIAEFEAAIISASRSKNTSALQSILETMEDIRTEYVRLGSAATLEELDALRRRVRNILRGDQ